jgi:phage terminase small subunit
MNAKDQGRRLTERQKAFVREYLIDLNATAAYKRAGYKCRGKNAEGAAGQIYRNLQVRAAIQAALLKAQERSAATVKRLELDLERIALSDVRKLFHPDGTMKSPHEWDDDTAAAAGSVEVREEFDGKDVCGYLKNVKFWDKLRAIVELLKRRDEAGKRPLGAKDNPIRQIQIIEIVRPAPKESN